MLLNSDYWTPFKLFWKSFFPLIKFVKHDWVANIAILLENRRLKLRHSSCLHHQIAKIKNYQFGHLLRSLQGNIWRLYPQMCSTKRSFAYRTNGKHRQKHSLRGYFVQVSDLYSILAISSAVLPLDLSVNISSSWVH